MPINRTLSIFICFISLFSYSQNNTTNSNSSFKEFINSFSGSLESNAQWYLNDKKTGEFEEQEHVRANSYFKLNYFFLKNFTAGIQIESYAPKPLLNYDVLFNKKIDVAQYFVSYQNTFVTATAGYFYEQFGSGLALRSWEDTALGVNNSLLGGNLKLTPLEFLEVKALFGKQRRGLDLSKSNITALNTTFNMSSNLNSTSINELSLAISYVNRFEKYKYTLEDNPDRINVPNSVSAYGTRLNLGINNFYSSFEYIYKTKDVRLNNVQSNNISFSENKLFDGNALLVNLGYSTKGLGVNYTFRRLENMSFYSQRNDANLFLNPTNRATLNYLPALTKQHDYTLANIYLYQAQPGLYVDNFEKPRVKAGEIGNQVDLFYNIKKGTALGGKYGTKLALNFSYWARLAVQVHDPDGIPYFSSDNLTYKSDFFNFKNKLFHDLNLEVKKKWNKNWSSIFTYINFFYNYNELVEANGEKINGSIFIGESTYKYGKGKSLRLELQFLQTKDDAKNWYGGTLEYFFNPKFGIYLNDSYNYQRSINEENYKIHFFNLGGSYSKGATRIALNYGRQRGGLICVGGVCRPVSKNTGVTLNLTTSF